MERTSFKPEPIRDPNGETGFIMVPNNEISLYDSIQILKAELEAVQTSITEQNIPEGTNVEDSSQPPTVSSE